ncbi:MAG: YbaK/EbsC family protein [Actinomycetota bacterium]|nr:YbaK/EbsC family protein [Actinomycetota bacterium]
MTDSTLLQHPSVVRVADALRAAGSSDQVQILDVTARTAQDAADALGVEVAQIVKSLVFTTPGHHGPEPLLVLTSGAHQVDVHKVADVLGLAALGRADADFVREHTGFAIGGVAPVGTTNPINTLIDVAFARYDVVWAAAGHPHAVFPTTYEELLRLTAGHPTEVA